MISHSQKLNINRDRSTYLNKILAMVSIVLLFQSTTFAAKKLKTSPAGWKKIRSVKMIGGLRVFWDVGGAKSHQAEAIKHGFDPVNLIGDYADYKGNNKRHIGHYLDARKPTNNPWDRPDYFEEIVRQNIVRIKKQPPLRKDAKGLFVHDIEFPFEQDIAKAWSNPKVKKASGAKTLKKFQEAYLAEWAKWYWLPCEFGKKTFPHLPTGIYGPQPFRRDYWGIVGKTAEQIDGTHALDAVFWKYIDPHVDFYIASVYIFYDAPGSAYYIASNVEENFNRTRQYGNKPVYAYSWMRFHGGNKTLGGNELPPWLADAAAVIPYFYGAKGNVLWGWEPKVKEAKLYGNLPIYTESIGRVADLSEKIANSTPSKDDKPAHVLWKSKRPLLKRLKVNNRNDEWIVLAMNPWQAENANSNLIIKCGNKSFTLKLQGRHCDIFHIIGNKIKRLQVDYKKATKPTRRHQPGSY